MSREDEIRDLLGRDDGTCGYDGVEHDPAEHLKPNSWVRNTGRYTEAHFAREHGWGPGTVLEGAPIVHDDKQYERGIYLRIIAIGEESVLARGHYLDEEREWHESIWTFTSRDWRVAL